MIVLSLLVYSRLKKLQNEKTGNKFCNMNKSIAMKKPCKDWHIELMQC